MMEEASGNSIKWVGPENLLQFSHMRELYILQGGLGELMWSLFRCDRCYGQWLALIDCEWVKEDTSDGPDDWHDSEGDFRFPAHLYPFRAALTLLIPDEAKTLLESDILQEKAVGRVWVTWRMNELQKEEVLLVTDLDAYTDLTIEQTAKHLINELKSTT